MKSVDQLEKTIRNKLSFTADGRLHNRILTEVLAAHEESKQGKSDPLSRNIRRVVMHSRIMKLAAALIIVGVSVGICYLTRDTHSSVAFADVVKEMQQIRTATWTEIDVVSPPKIKGTIQIVGNHIRQSAYKAPGHERQDTTQTLVDPRTGQPAEFKNIHIIDRNVGKALLLNPQEMTAAIHSFDPNVHQNALYDVFLNPPENIPSDAQSLGTKQIGNREAIGFRLQKKTDGTYPWSGDITDIWVDAKTRLLVMLETGAADGGWMFRLKDFAFNQELDDSLFSLDPPQGYRMLIPPPKVLSVEPPKQD